MNHEPKSFMSFSFLETAVGAACNMVGIGILKGVFVTEQKISSLAIQKKSL